MKYLLVRQWRFLFANLAYRLCDKDLRHKIDCDVSRYLKWTEKMKGVSNIQRFDYCLLDYVEFRNVFYYRIQHHPRLIAFCKIFLRPADAVVISGEIGEGLYISHRVATVCPMKAGKNLRIGPGVVIGKNRGKRPFIGDNVYIAANAVVVGGIHIGDNVIVGAGSVVTKDLPSDGIYVGNPARFIRNINDSPELLDEIM